MQAPTGKAAAESFNAEPLHHPPARNRKFRTERMSAERKRRQHSSPQYGSGPDGPSREEIYQEPRHALLRERLLRFGGREVCFAVKDQHIDILATDRARVWSGGDRVKLLRGRPSQCHRNAAHFYAKRFPSFAIVTGYAMCESGLWIQHSWLLKNGTVYDATGARLAYAGVPLNDTETALFVVSNWDGGPASFLTDCEGNRELMAHVSAGVRRHIEGLERAAAA